MTDYYAIRLELEFKHSLAWCDAALSKIIGELSQHVDDIKKGTHTEKTVSIFFISCCAPKLLMERLKPIFSEFDSINNAWCGECPFNFVGMNGAFDAAAIAIQTTIRKAEFLTESNNVEYAKVFQTRI
jgi:hypothetical protein